MSGAGTARKLLLVFGLMLTGVHSALALTDCLFPADLDSLLPEYRYVFPESLLPDAFNAVFTLETTWNPDYVDWWPDSTIIAFANLVMPDTSGSVQPEDSYAHRTAEFFGVDQDDSYPGVHFQYIWAGGEHDLDHFTIYLTNVEGSSASFDHVNLGIQDSTLTAEQVAIDHFAHEWGHVSYFSTGATGSNGCPSFGEKWISSGDFWDYGTHEFMAKSSEFYNGMDAENWYGKFTEQPLTVGIGRDDWYEQCRPGAQGENRRWIYFPFTAYLQDHFNDEGLLYDWIHWNQTCDEDSTNAGPHDFDYLAFHLGNGDYAASFSESSGDARLRELFREYALSMWVNSDHLFDDNPDASVHMPLHEGASPRYNFGYFRPDYDDTCCVGGNWCPDDALSLPYYVDVTTDVTEVTSPLYASDFGCDGPDYFNFRRELTFDSYAFSPLPFRAADSLIDSGRCYDFELRLVLDGSVECGDDEYLDWSSSDNDYLHFWVLGYPENRDSLDTFGSEAVLIDDVGYSSLAAGDTLSFTVPCFASAYKAIALVATLTQVEAASGTAYAHVIPYHYACWAEDKTGDLTISANTTWETEDSPICLGGLATVETGATLSVEPGVTIWCANPDSVGDDVGFLLEGDLDLAGSEGEPIVLKPILDHWDGFTVADDGILEADHVTAEGFDHLACQSTAARVRLLDSDFTLSPIAGGFEFVGFDFQGADSVLIADCEIHEATILILADHRLQDSKIYQRSGAQGTAVMIDGDATLDNVVIYSAHTAIKCQGGNPTLTEVSANSASVSSCAQNPTQGLTLTSDADVAANQCTFSGFCKAIRLDDSSRLTLRNSEIDEAMDLGVYIDDRNPVADLGYNICCPTDTTAWGHNCISMDDSPDIRVFNRGTSTCWAVKNYWGTSSPTSSLFQGSVAWSTYLTSCPGGTGGPGFSINVMPVADAGSWRFAPPVPNPFNPSCELQFSLPATGAPSALAIYDLSGRHLRTLFAGLADGGEHRLRWDGRDERGRAVSSGVYLARLQAGPEIRSRKLVVLK